MSYDEAEASRELDDCEKRIAYLRGEAAQLAAPEKKLTAENDLKKAATALETIQEGILNNKLSSNGKYEISNLQRDLDKAEAAICGAGLDLAACQEFIKAVNSARTNPQSFVDDIEADIRKSHPYQL
jgi:hypothetical protein